MGFAICIALNIGSNNKYLVFNILLILLMHRVLIDKHVVNFVGIYF